MHASHPSETHYFPLLSGPHRRILLHTHLEAPFVDPPTLERSAVNFKIYSSGETGCQTELSGFDISIDWSATLGRWSSRYLNTLLSWAAGVASLVVFLGWMQEDVTCELFSQSITQQSRDLWTYSMDAHRRIFIGNFHSHAPPLLCSRVVCACLYSSTTVTLRWEQGDCFPDAHSSRHPLHCKRSGMRNLGNPRPSIDYLWQS